MASTKPTVNTRIMGPIKPGDHLPTHQLLILGLQHAFTMFGATVLVPLLTGLDVSVALFTAGIGTLWFHLVTRGRVPVFLGSSFAFIAPVAMVVAEKGIPAAQGGIIVAGFLYVAFGILIHFLGPDFFRRTSSSTETLSLNKKTCKPLARASPASLAAYSPGTDIAAIPAPPTEAASDRVA
jgi:hypothetical protein